MCAHVQACTVHAHHDSEAEGIILCPYFQNYPLELSDTLPALWRAHAKNLSSRKTLPAPFPGTAGIFNRPILTIHALF